MQHDFQSPGNGGNGTPSTTDRLRSTAQNTAEAATGRAKAAVAEVGDEMRRRADEIKHHARSAAETAKQQAGEVAESMKQRARTLAEDQKAAGAEQLSGFARAINQAADELQDQLPQAAEFVRGAASKVDDISARIRDHSVEDLVQDVNDFARANTVTFFGLSLAAGFALSRFLKSSATASSPTPDRSSASAAPYPAPPRTMSASAAEMPDHFTASPSTQF